MENKTIAVNLKDFYQLLIAECRYGYTRNNHLMPSGAYEKVKQYFPEMLKVDDDWAIHTLKQICEECISEQLVMNFYDGEDDEFKNRQEAIDFISWCLNEIHKVETYWFPYNMNQYLENLKKDDEPRYNVYLLDGSKKILLTEEPISSNKYIDFIFNQISANGGTYTKEVINLYEKDFSDRRRNYIYHILEPVKKDFYVEHI